MQYHRFTSGTDIDEENVDFEEFCRFLDIEHFLRLRGSDTWSADGNEGTVVIKTLIGQILSERMPRPNEVPELYCRFAERLRPNDVVLTFNYDVLLERALDAVRVPYRLYPGRLESVHDGFSVIDDSRSEVILLKVHGSIDWFDRAEYNDAEHECRAAGASARPVHPVFGPTGDDLTTTKLLDGPHQPDDPLSEMYRVADIERLYKRSWMFLAAPWLLAPSTMKILYAAKLLDFWDGRGRDGILNFGLAIIGYSLPDQDAYARQAVYSIITNYQSEYWDDEVLGRRKSPLVLVDLRRGSNAIREFENRYRFVNWERAVRNYRGFDRDSLDQIFAS